MRRKSDRNGRRHGLLAAVFLKAWRPQSSVGHLGRASTGSGGRRAHVRPAWQSRDAGGRERPGTPAAPLERRSQLQTQDEHPAEADAGTRRREGDRDGRPVTTRKGWGCRTGRPLSRSKGASATTCGRAREAAAGLGSTWRRRGSCQPRGGYRDAQPKRMALSPGVSVGRSGRGGEDAEL